MDHDSQPPPFRRRPPLGSDAARSVPSALDDAPPPPPPPPPSSPLFGARPAPRQPPSFTGGPVFVQHGTTGAMMGVAAVNLLLNVVTLSLWRFWGKTRVRRFLWGNTTAWGDPVEYTGTGKELFIGFLLVAVVVFLPLMLAFGAIQAMVVAFPPAGLLILPLQLLVLFLIGAGLYRARRYQMSRTVWRGIRGGLDGSALSYGITFMLVTLAAIVSLGWTIPWGEMKLARMRLDNTTFGSGRFDCDAPSAALYKRFAVVWLSGLLFLGLMGGWFATVLPEGIEETSDPTALVGAAILGYAGAAVIALFTLAVPLAWYKAAFYRQLAAHTRFGPLIFSAKVETWPLIRLTLGNWLIGIGSLGVLRPVAALRTFRYACSVIEVDGRLDFGQLAQSTAERPGTGEGLVAVLDGAGDF